MAVQATYEVHVDLTGNRLFTDTNEDLSSYWKRMSWQLGMASSFDALARAATMEIVLDNQDGRFSPEHGSGLSGFQPGALLRIRSTYDSVTRQHFIGWIDAGGIRPAPGTRGQRETLVRASGFLSRIMTEEVFVPVQEGKRSDEIVNTLVLSSDIYPPGMIGWLLGMSGFANLDSSSRLSAGISDYALLDTGQTVFNYAGDNWEQGVSVFGALRDVMQGEGEGALLYVDREGKLIFKSRHWPHQDQVTALDATLTESDIKENGLAYAYGTRILNDVTLSLRPRTVGSSPEVLGTLDSELRVDPGQSETTRIRFDDGSGNRIGGKDLITTVATTDFTARTLPGGGGSDVTNNITVTLEVGGNGAELTFSNGGSQTAFIQSGAQVRGTKITDYGQQQIRREDETSILTHGRQAEERSMRLLDDPGFATRLAEWLVESRKDPHGEIEAISIVANKSDALMEEGLARTIGDRISLSEGQTGSSGEYYIVGEWHQVNNKYHHLVTWALRPVPATTAWVLGTTDFSELSESALLVF